MYNEDLRRLLEPLLLAVVLSAALAAESRPFVPVSVPDFSAAAARWQEAYKGAESMIGMGN